MVSQLLELTHLVQDHGMAKVKIRCGRIEPRLDAQRSALGELSNKVLLDDELVDTAPDDLEVGLLTH